MVQTRALICGKDVLVQRRASNFVEQSVLIQIDFIATIYTVDYCLSFKYPSIKIRMQVTPALKKELAQWLDTYWSTYLKGDIETWATFIRDDYRNIGGTKEEIWNSKQEIIDYTNRIMDQMLGTAEIRNREIEVIPYGEYMMVNEFTDLYVKIEGEWTFYGPFRLSSLLEKTDTGWIALHQHGSYPDMKALEGEAFSIDALKAENAKAAGSCKEQDH